VLQTDRQTDRQTDKWTDDSIMAIADHTVLILLLEKDIFNKKNFITNWC